MTVDDFDFSGTHVIADIVGIDPVAIRDDRAILRGLDEGLALYLEGRALSWSETIMDGRETELTPLHALHGSFLSLSPHEARLAYAESLSAAWALIHRYGWPRVRRLLETVAGSDDFSAAFETALKEPYHVFEASWATARRHRSL